jgi:DNA-binding NtrC family response regulator
MIQTTMNRYRSNVLTEGPSVLVVDDEPSVRRLLGVLLQGHGYRAVMAADGVEARTVIEREDIAVILCDVHLRGESGKALVQDLHRQSPGAIVFMISGSDESDAPDGTGESWVCGHIVKPFDVKDVVHRIAQVLCGRRVGVERTSVEDRLLTGEM